MVEEKRSYKKELNEYIQKATEWASPPYYDCDKVGGTVHAPVFAAKVTIFPKYGGLPVTASSELSAVEFRTKKAAEQAAAKELLACLPYNSNSGSENAGNAEKKGEKDDSGDQAVDRENTTLEATFETTLEGDGGHHLHLHRATYRKEIKRCIVFDTTLNDVFEKYIKSVFAVADDEHKSQDDTMVCYFPPNSAMLDHKPVLAHHSVPRSPFDDARSERGAVMAPYFYFREATSVPPGSRGWSESVSWAAADARLVVETMRLVNVLHPIALTIVSSNRALDELVHLVAEVDGAPATERVASWEKLQNTF